MSSTPLSDLVQIFREGATALMDDITSLKILDRREMLTGCLVCRLLNHFEAIWHLHQSKMPIEVDTILRSGLETIFWLGAVARHPDEFIEEISQDDNYSRRSLARHVLNIPQDMVNFDEATRLALTERRDDSTPEGGLKRLQIIKVAEAAGLGSLYSLYISLSNQAAHPSAASLNRHLITPQRGEPHLSPAIGDANETYSISLVCELVFYAKVYLDEVFGLDKGWREKLWERYTDAIERVKID